MKTLLVFIIVCLFACKEDHDLHSTSNEPYQYFSWQLMGDIDRFFTNKYYGVPSQSHDTLFIDCDVNPTDSTAFRLSVKNQIIPELFREVFKPYYATKDIYIEFYMKYSIAVYEEFNCCFHITITLNGSSYRLD